VQQLGDHAVASLVTLGTQFRSQPADTLAGPAQGRLWVATGTRLNKALQIVAQCEVKIHGLLPTASRPADAPSRHLVGKRAIEFVKALPDCAPRDAGGP